ncbi:MAG TPA: DJ-1/PfpI family protein [Pyrinomonadaceae bacterium]|jgi:putative intracellular protease/amidase|nr:DJ-1/PfpI family protein [Pyrinomonadaceae bacterium]
MKKAYLIMALLIIAAASTWSLVAMSQAGKTVARESAQPKPRSRPRNLAILIFDGVQIIDYTGPFETFGHVYSKDGPAFNIYTVSEKTAPITTAMGMSVNPKYSFENAPRPDVLLIPGGDVEGQVANPAAIKWVQEKARDAEVVLSVCNGAFILAKAGLLDGLEATTTSNLIPYLKKEAPKTRVVDDRRFVDNGKIITAAGLSSGIDGSLHVIERLFGRGTAQMAALGMEYNWDSESKFVRAALADKYLRFNFEIKVREDGWRPLSREGNTDQWENRWLVSTDISAAEILESVNNAIAGNKTYGASLNTKWVRLNNVSTRSDTQSLWQFTDEKGGVWNGTVRVEPVAGERNQFTLSVRISRSSSNGTASAQLPAR